MKLRYLSTGHKRLGKVFPTPVKWCKTEDGAICYQNLLTGKFYYNDGDSEIQNVKGILYEG